MKPGCALVVFLTAASYCGAQIRASWGFGKCAGRYEFAGRSNDLLGAVAPQIGQESGGRVLAEHEICECGHLGVHPAFDRSVVLDNRGSMYTNGVRDNLIQE